MRPDRLHSPRLEPAVGASKQEEWCGVSYPPQFPLSRVLHKTTRYTNGLQADNSDISYLSKQGFVVRLVRRNLKFIPSIVSSRNKVGSGRMRKFCYYCQLPISSSSQEGNWCPVVFFFSFASCDCRPMGSVTLIVASRSCIFFPSLSTFQHFNAGLIWHWISWKLPSALQMGVKLLLDNEASIFFNWHNV